MRRTAILTAGILATAAVLQAGGPLLLVEPGQPYLWPGNPPTLVFRPDSGSLGALEAPLSTQLIRDAAQQWTDIPTSSIRLLDGGFVESLEGPEGPGDFAVSNALSLVGRFNGGVTPIILDSEDADGNGTGDLLDLLGLTGVNGVGSPEFTNAEGTLVEGIVIINGARVVDEVSAQSFRGTMTHELGHLINLAHTVVNGQAVLFGGSDAVYPDGTPLNAQPEHVETMFPFSSTSTSVFRFTPHADDVAIVSTLYPDPSLPLSSLGSIRGTLFSAEGEPLTGGQIIARNQAGNPLMDAVSAISGDFVQGRLIQHPLTGVYRLNTLTPGGRYSLEVRDTVAGGFSTDAFRIQAFSFPGLPPMPGPEEFYSGPMEGSQSPPDDPTAAPFLIDVTPGGPEQAVQADLVLNRFIPMHDDCLQAVDIPLDQLPLEDTRTTLGATLEADEPGNDCAFGLDLNTGSVWYRLRNQGMQGTTVGVIVIGDYDYTIQAYAGGCGDLLPIEEACSFGSAFFNQTLTVQLAPGEERLLRVSPVFEGNAGGTLQLLVFDSAPPLNDICPNAEAILPEDLPFTDSLDAARAFAEAGGAGLSCVPEKRNSLWYQFSNDSPQGVEVEASTRGSTYDTALQVYTGTCGAENHVECDDDSGPEASSETTFTAEPGGVYRIQVVSNDPQAGQLNFRLRRSPDPPLNDDCAAAVPLLVSQLPLMLQADTSRAGNEDQEPVTTCGEPFVLEQSKSVWYRLLNDRAVPLDLLLKTEGSDFNTLLQVYRGSCFSFQTVACDDSSGPESTSRIEMRAEPGVEYWIKAASRGEEPGGQLILQAQILNRQTPSDLELTLLESQPRTTARGRLTYRLAAANRSRSTLSGAGIRIDLPDSVEVLDSASDFGDCTSDAEGLLCPIGLIEPGREGNIEVSVSPRAAGGTSLTATAEWDEAAPDEPRSLTLGAQVDPFVIFPARLEGSTVLASPSGDTSSGFFDNFFVGTALFNAGFEEDTVGIDGLDAQGRTIFVNESALLLPPEGQSAVTVDELSPAFRQSVILAAYGRSQPIRGFFLAGDSMLDKLDGVGQRLQASRDLYFPLVQQSDKASTRLLLFNPTLETAQEVLLELVGPQGSIASATVSIAGNGSLATETEALFGGLAVQEAYLRVESPQPLEGFEFIGTSKSVAALAAQPTPATLRYFSPHFFVDDRGDRTIVRLYSAEEVPLFVLANLYDDSGSPIASTIFVLQPGRLLAEDVGTLFDVEAGPGEVLTGHMSFIMVPQDFIGFRGPFSRVIGTVEFTGAGGETRSILAMPSGGSLSFRFLQVAQTRGSIFTGLAIVGPPTGSAALVHVLVFGPDGRVNAERMIEVGANRRVIGLLNEDQFFGPNFQQQGGHIEVHSDRVVTVFALFGDYAGHFLSAIEGQE